MMRVDYLHQGPFIKDLLNDDELEKAFQSRVLDMIPEVVRLVLVIAGFTRREPPSGWA